MAALAEIFIKKETLQTILKALEVKEEKGFSLTISINDESNEWGQNVSGFASQTKEQREQKKQKFYVGNGKVFWTDGSIKLAAKKENTLPDGINKDGEPFSQELPF